ncbi:MAG: hypothetical protein LBC62_07915 [Treponema sp.]|jgi:hypothetical protein|nr:hypothetical protein [Treponema sp.]
MEEGSVTFDGGIRLNALAFVVGGGLMYYIPFKESSETEISKGGGSNVPKTKQTDSSFDRLRFMSGYFDLGFDLSGRTGRTHGFGMVIRTTIGFPDKIATSKQYHYDPYKHLVFSLVFNYSGAVATFPIGG